MSSEEKRIIKIDEETFKLPSSKTRKNAKGLKGIDKEIRIKGSSKPHNKTAKHKILRYIRDAQKKAYDNLVNGVDDSFVKDIIGGKDKLSQVEGTKENDFVDSVEYLKTVINENDPPKKQRPMNGGNHNHTIKTNTSDEQFLKNMLHITQPNGIVQPVVQPSPIGLMPIQLNNVPILPGTMQLKPATEPPYGCLKYGGVKPTYKQWQMQHNVTQKSPGSNPPIQSQQQPRPAQFIQQPQQPQMPQPPPQSPIQPPIQNIPIKPNPFYGAPQPTPKTDDRLKEISRIKQLREFMKNAKKESPTPPKLKYQKRKKTIKRTHFVGKSKVHPKVAVLVSNKTIRANINKKKMEIKQTSMEDIRRYLTKHGFIRVGSIAPNDVLKQMYESLQLMNADIKNHNPENMLYNYFNDNQS